ncbi:MAG: CAP domain-containing protein [Oscillospiraceae bacterium]|jgi:hypothetical protein|nr:CAP domain-containing protein [Oscillospiraceae bacterium]
MKRFATYLFTLLLLSGLVIFTAAAASEPSAYEWEVFDLVNAARTDAGLPELQFTAEAYNVAQLRAGEVLRSFSHTRPNGTNFSQAFTDCGVTYSFAAENIAYGQSSPAQVVRDWLNSPGHYANIMSTSVKYIGVSYTVGQGNSPAWTQEFYSPNQWNGGTVTVLSRAGQSLNKPPVVVTPPPAVVTPPPVVVTPPTVVVTPPPAVETPPAVVTPPVTEVTPPPVTVIASPERGFFPSFMKKDSAPPVAVVTPPAVTETPPVVIVKPPVTVAPSVPKGFFPSFMCK